MRSKVKALIRDSLPARLPVGRVFEKILESSKNYQSICQKLDHNSKIQQRNEWIVELTKRLSEEGIACRLAK